MAFTANAQLELCFARAPQKWLQIRRPPGKPIMQLLSFPFCPFSPSPLYICPLPTPHSGITTCLHTHACASRSACASLTAACDRHPGRLFLVGDAATAAVGAPWCVGARPPPISPPCGLRYQVRTWHLAEFSGPAYPWPAFAVPFATWPPC